MRSFHVSRRRAKRAEHDFRHIAPAGTRLYHALDVGDDHPGAGQALDGGPLGRLGVRPRCVDDRVHRVPLSEGGRGRLLWQEPMVLVTGRMDPLVGDDPVSLSAVGSRPFVDFPDGWAVRYEVDRALLAAQAARGRRFEVNDLLSAADLVEYSLAVTILPGSLAQRFRRLLVRPIERHVPHWRVMLVHRRGELSEPVRTFLNLLR